VDHDSTNAPALVGTFVRNLELPSGGWVVLRDPLELRGKDRREVQRAIMDPDRKIASALDVTDGTICMLVESWSLPYAPNAPLPRVDPRILGELTIADQMALEQAIDPALKVLFPREETIDDAGVPGSPTPPASA
jgi:hypothetical protein